MYKLTVNLFERTYKRVCMNNHENLCDVSLL